MAPVKSTRFHIKLDNLLSLFFVTTIVLSTPLPGLKAQLRIDQWTTDNGLPHNSVTGIARTPDGYIWFTTNEGLVRFDGVRFEVFNRSNTPELTNNGMSGAIANKSGTKWMNTEEGEILFAGLMSVRPLVLSGNAFAPGSAQLLLQASTQATH